MSKYDIDVDKIIEKLL